MADNIVLKVTTPGARQATTQLQSLTSSATRLVGVIGALGVGIAFIRSIKLMRDFELTMATVRAISGSTNEEFKRLENTARSLGATTIFSAKQAAEGMTFLAQAGLNTTEIINATASSLRLAQSANLALADSADLVAKTLKQFSLEATKANTVVDILSKTAASSNTTVSQLGEALKFVAPIAAALGFTLSQTAAAIGTLGNTGIQASQAGTSLRTILIRLQSPSERAREILDRLGLSQEYLKNNATDLVSIFTKLRPVLNSVSDANELFGRIAIASGLSLIKNVDSLKELNISLEDSAGFAQEVANIMGDTLSGAFKSLVSGLEEAQLAIGDTGFLSGLKNLVKITAGAVSILNGMEQQFIANTKISKTQITIMNVLAASVRVLGAAVSVLVGAFIALRAVRIVAFFGSIQTAIKGLVFILSTVLVYFLQQETTALNTSIARWKLWLNNITAAVKFVQSLVSTLSFDEALKEFDRFRAEGLKRLVADAQKAKEDLAKAELGKALTQGNTSQAGDDSGINNSYAEATKVLKDYNDIILENVKVKKQVEYSNEQIQKSLEDLKRKRLEVIDSNNDLIETERSLASQFQAGVIDIKKYEEDTVKLIESKKALAEQSQKNIDAENEFTQALKTNAAKNKKNIETTLDIITTLGKTIDDVLSTIQEFNEIDSKQQDLDKRIALAKAEQAAFRESSKFNVLESFKYDREILKLQIQRGKLDYDRQELIRDATLDGLQAGASLTKLVGGIGGGGNVQQAQPVQSRGNFFLGGGGNVNNNPALLNQNRGRNTAPIITINNDVPNVNIQPQVRENDGGGFNIDIVIEQGIQTVIQSGAVDNLLQQRFNLERRA